MTDKEKLEALKANIERLIQTEQGFKTGEAERAYRMCAEDILSNIDDLQKEQKSVWHDTKEKPKEGSRIAFWDGMRMMGMDYADCRHLNSWLKHSDKWAYVDELLNL